MSKSYFNKVASLRPANFLKEASTQVFSCAFCGNFKNTFFYRIPPKVASVRHLFALKINWLVFL